MAMGYKQTAKPEPTPRPPLYKPLSAMSYDEFDDDIEITYQGTKIIRADRRPRRPEPGMMSPPSPFTCPRAGFVPNCPIAHTEAGSAMNHSLLEETWRAEMTPVRP